MLLHVRRAWASAWAAVLVSLACVHTLRTMRRALSAGRPKRAASTKARLLVGFEAPACRPERWVGHPGSVGRHSTAARCSCQVSLHSAWMFTRGMQHAEGKQGDAMCMTRLPPVITGVSRAAPTIRKSSMRALRISTIQCAYLLSTCGRS